MSLDRPEPVAAARLQLTPEFGFDAAAAVVPYLSRLGVSHLYTSPVAEAVAGSQHGYDVTQPGRVRTELGGESGLARLLDGLAAEGMGWLVDIVPNHVAVVPAEQNPWWWDVLTHGPASPFAATFDIDWEAGGGTVVLPSGSVDVAAARVSGDTIEIAGARLPLAPGTAPPAGRPGAPDVPHDIGELLARQHWSLSGLSGQRRNYRCFFAIAELGAVRVERPEVFDRMHELVRNLRHHRAFAGVRVDHVDGLADPDGYLRRLRDLVGPDAWLVVEKILLGDEALPGRWPVDGTTGYEFCRDVTALLTDPAGMPGLDALWHEVAGSTPAYAEVEHAAEVEVAERMLGPDLARFARLVVGAAPHLAPTQVEAATAELCAALPVYRTYLPAGGAADEAVLAAAAERAAARRADLGPVLRQLVGLAVDGTHPDITTRLQQLSGPVTAKGAEDTAFYRYLRLVAHNEVGGDPACDGTGPDRFHRQRLNAQQSWPRSLLTTSTHDTKRSEDVRTRLLVLAQRAGEWRAAVRRWGSGAARYRGPCGPSPALEHLAWQTMVGAWPIERDRLWAALLKSAREAAVDTTWEAPAAAVEDDLARWLDGVLADGRLCGEVAAFVAGIDAAAQALSLVQVLLRLTSPGVGDLYQGCDLWDRSLMDPDNRRPVDWDARRLLLGRADATDLAACHPEAPQGDGPGAAAGMSKLVLIQRTLRHRRDHLADFGPGPQGAYRAVDVTGTGRDGLLAFGRGTGTVVAVHRFPGTAAHPGHASLTLPPGRFGHVLVDGRAALEGRVTAGALLGGLPVALLARR